jgi:hypothetical protein
MALDHDAKGLRGAERQRYTEGLVSELYDLAEINANQTADRGSDMWLVEFAIGLLAMLDKFGGQHRPLLFGSKERETRQTLQGVCDRIANFALDEPEAQAIGLEISERLLNTATGSIKSSLSTWESKTFQEEAMAAK